jgi:peptide/nickel transport system substrate-binding protein
MRVSKDQLRYGDKTVTQVFERSVTRRDLGRYAAATAALATLVPAEGSVAAAQGASSSPAPERPRGGTVTVAQAGEPDSLDPQIALSGISGQVHNNLYDTLIGLNADFRYEGILAESWDVSGDGLEYTFHLRSGIAFHDGSPFNADAVKFTFDRILDPKTKANQAATFSVLKETMVVDPLTVKFVLKEPFSPFLSYLAASYNGGAILPPGAVQKSGSDFGTNPVGTGPWKFNEWVRGSTVTFVRNDNYQNFHSYMENKGAPYLDQLVFSNIPEASTQIAALDSGEVQVVFSLPPVEVDRLKADSSYDVVIPTTSLITQYIEFAMVKPTGDYGAQFKPPFDDLRVRQAVGYALDVDTIIAKVLFGLATRDYGPLPTAMFAYTPKIEQYGFHYDPNKAKALLDQAGWTNAGGGTRTKDGKPLDLVLWTWNLSPNDKIVQVMQNQLDAVGMSVKVEVLEVGTFLSTLVGGPANFDMTASRGFDPNMLNEIVVYNLPLSFYRDRQYVELLDQASRTSDLNERFNLYFEAQKKMVGDAAIIPLFCLLTASGVRGAKGLKIAPTSLGAYEDMYIEK